MRCAFVLLAASTVAASAKADPLVEYHAAEACPSEDEFVASLHERMQESWSFEPGSRSFRVDLDHAPSGRFVGRFTSLEHDVPVAERLISARSCADLAEAMAFVVALAVDAEARIRVEVHARRATLLPSPPVKVAPVREEPTVLVHHPLGVRAAAGGGVTSAVGPAAPTFSTSIEIVWPSGLRPSVELGSDFAFASAQTNPGWVDLTLWTLNVGVCPVRLAAGDILEVTPCASLGAGFLRPAVHGLADANESPVPWASAALDVRVLVWLGRAGVRLAGGAEVPFTRPTFETNARTLFATPAVAASASLALIVRLR